MDLVEAVRADIRGFKERNGASRCVMIWCASTEAYLQPAAVHGSLKDFEDGLKKSDPRIPPSMLYAYAALTSGIPYINGAPNLTVDLPAMVELAEKCRVPIAGKDFKTGQTLMKTILAPGLKARMLGLTGWYSTNILGNRDGLVLDDKDSFKTKEESKLSVLQTILQPDLYSQLYRDFYHKVVISYYPPRGDAKEGWDCIDIFGWLGYPMQIKVNFLCRDSILAAPLVLDLVLFADLAQRAEMSGIQEWLSFYFKSPQCAENLYPEHDLFIQSMKLKNTLRYLMGEEQITHLGERTSVSDGARRIGAVVKPFLEKQDDLLIVSETYLGMSKEELETIASALPDYPEGITLSWQLYDDGRMKVDEGVKSPRPHGVAALRTNSDVFYGVREDGKNIAEALRRSKAAGLDWTYIYGEHPDDRPVVRDNYEAWYRHSV